MCDVYPDDALPAPLKGHAPVVGAEVSGSIPCSLATRAIWLNSSMGSYQTSMDCNWSLSLTLATTKPWISMRPPWGLMVTFSPWL